MPISPILRRYVEQVAAEMPGVRLLFMQSSGGLTDAHASRARTPSSPARRAASWAWRAPRSRPGMTA
jgi:N-methylhydantoinase A/oxoprolinase/acetone carboxylase beta subunit